MATGVAAQAAERPEPVADAPLAESRDAILLRRISGGRFRDHEVQKLHTKVFEAHAEARRVIGTGGVGAHAVQRFNELAALDATRLNLDAMLELVEEWDRWLIANGDRTYLFSLLEAEYMRATQDHAGTSVTWNDVYPHEKRIAASARFRLGSELTAEDVEAARRRLAGLYRARAIAYGLERARTRGRNRTLMGLTLIVLLIGGALAFGLAAADPQLSPLLLAVAATAGAVGAALAGARRLQDGLRRINLDRQFVPLIVSQMSVGATIGIVLLVLLEGGAVPLDLEGSPVVVTGTVAFLGGFAEPFFLGIVERLTRTANPERSMG